MSNVEKIVSARLTSQFLTSKAILSKLLFTSYVAGSFANHLRTWYLQLNIIVDWRVKIWNIQATRFRLLCSPTLHFEHFVNRSLHWFRALSSNVHQTAWRWWFARRKNFETTDVLVEINDLFFFCAVRKVHTEKMLNSMKKLLRSY